jgi:hypothetical protein
MWIPAAVGVVSMALAITPARAQQRPDFNGVWHIDVSRSERDVYGQLRIITQHDTAIEMTALQYSDYSRAWNVIPWTFRINRWGPRRGGERSREPIVQARWDGDRLIAVKSPGESYSVLWIWSLAADGREMFVDAVGWTSLPRDFDFKESSIPAAYARNRFVYVKKSADACADCAFIVDERGVHADDGAHAVAFQLRGNFELNVMCRVAECALMEIVKGRRDPPRTRAAGGSATIPLSAQTVIEAVNSQLTDARTNFQLRNRYWELGIGSSEAGWEFTYGWIDPSAGSFRCCSSIWRCARRMFAMP